MNQTFSSLNPSSPSINYAKKPNHLLAFLGRRPDPQPAQKSFIIRSHSRLNSSLNLSPTNKSSSPKLQRGGTLQSQHSREYSPIMPKPVSTNTMSNIQDDLGDRKATVKFGTVMQLQKISDEDKKEESIERYLTVRKYIKELRQIKIFEDHEGRMLSKKRVAEESEKVMKLAMNFFTAMNIRIKEPIEPISDSAMTIFPAEERKDLAAFYKMLVVEIFEFPYAFIAKLKILMFTVCDEVSLFNPAYSVFLDQKRNNGLFILKEILTEEDVRDHWYRIVSNHFAKADSSLYEDWKQFVRSENSKVVIKKFDIKSEMEELFLVFKCVMRPQEASQIVLPRLEQKIKFLKKLLKAFEPACFDEDWWDMKYNNSLYYREDGEV